MGASLVALCDVDVSGSADTGEADEAFVRVCSERMPLDHAVSAVPATVDLMVGHRVAPSEDLEGTGVRNESVTTDR